MPAKGILFRFWISGSILHDGNYCQAIEGGWASRLDDVTLRFSSGLYFRRAVYAVASWCHQQYRGFVAPHRGLPHGNWEKDWRRQLSGILHSALLFQLQFLSDAHPVVLFYKKGIDDYFFIEQMARSKFRWLNLILKTCKSSFLEILHLVHFDTYAFRKFNRSF